MKYNWKRFYLKHKNIAFYVCNHDNVSVAFPARKSTVERKIAMKTWDILKATYLIALLHISNENTRSRHLLCGIKGVRLISYSSQTRSTPPFFITSFGFPRDRQCIYKVWKKSIEWIFIRENTLTSITFHSWNWVMPVFVCIGLCASQFLPQAFPLPPPPQQWIPG